MKKAKNQKIISAFLILTLFGLSLFVITDFAWAQKKGQNQGGSQSSEKNQEGDQNTNGDKDHDRDRIRLQIKDPSNCDQDCFLAQERIRQRDQVLRQIYDESSQIQRADLNGLMAGYQNTNRNRVLEGNVYTQYTQNMFINSQSYNDHNKVASSVNIFIAYGTQSTQGLGERERAGVLKSYQRAFGKLPETELQWEDLIKISNGNWPSVKNEQSEKRAKELFLNIYKREANMQNINDEAAIKIIAYGIRPKPRNVISEQRALSIFSAIYKRVPSNTEDWNVLRAIAYSGASK